MFYKKSDSGFKNALIKGVSLKTLAFGEKTQLTEFRLDKGCVVPKHVHPHEQTGYLISGKMRFYIGDEVYDAESGDGWSITGDVEHGVEVLEDSVVIEVFSPIREDYQS